MGYQALLFCPDERTARTVTQVLSELEFNVEACTEPFAAVKKLMGQHFDAVVVDCDNEQNATLLFKSARNSASNQASLAVAVVEGQAGVAKAFRIGANLVLTKPINVEQAKGTLRVARGLLRKGETLKPGSPAGAAPAAAQTPAAAPAKPAPRPASTTPSASSAVSAPRPAARPVAKPSPSPAPVRAAAAANSAPIGRDVVLPEIKDLAKSKDERSAAPAPPAAKSPAFTVPASAAMPAPAFKSAPEGPTFGSGAASAPAPAREAEPVEVVAASPSSAPADAVVDRLAEVQPATSTAPPPSFTFGGANLPEASGSSKKILLPIAAVVLVASGAYAGWTYYQGHLSHAVSSTPAPFSAPAVKPSTVPAAPAAKTAAPAPSPITQPVTQPAVDTTAATAPPAKSSAAESDDSAVADDSASPARTPKSASASGSSAAKKTAPAAEPAEAPLVVKGGVVPKTHTKTEAADTPAPNMTGIAATGASAPPPSLIGDDTNALKPILQTMNVSQGVSQGLLYKKIAPVYPQTAMSMHIEGPVELRATISKTGDITAVKVLSGDSQLAKAAVAAVKQWKYKPYLLNGEPVEIQTQVTINFKLPN